MKLFARRGFEFLEDSLEGLWSPVLTGRTDSVLLDCSGFANHGAFTNYATIQSGWLGTTFGSVLNFDGTDDYVLCGSQRPFPNVGRMTLSFWINSTLGTSGAIPFTFGSNAYELAYRSTTLSFGTPGNGWCQASGTYYYPNQWVHLVGTQSGTTAGMGALYLNGQPLPLTLNQAPTINAIGPITILGLRNTSLASPLTGMIAEASAHSRPLSPSEIQQLYSVGPGGAWQLNPRRRTAYGGSAGFKAYWARRQSQLIGGGL